MTRNAWIVFVVVCAVLFGGLFIYSKKDSVDVSKIDGTKVNVGIPESGGIKDATLGNKDAKVVLIEYGDYQCPACHDMHPVVKPIVEDNKDKMLFVFRNFPLSDKHPNARAAAASAETAGLMGKYWEMHNALYERYNDWVSTTGDNRTAIFKTIAKDTGLNADEFMKKLEEKSDSLNKKINFDKALGLKQQVDATPTFFLNGRKLSGDDIKNVDAFKKVITAEIAKAK